MPRHQVQRTSLRSFFPYKIDNKHLLPPPPPVVNNNNLAGKHNLFAYCGCLLVDNIEHCKKKFGNPNSQEGKTESDFFFGCCANNKFRCFPSEISSSITTCSSTTPSQAAVSDDICNVSVCLSSLHESAVCRSKDDVTQEEKANYVFCENSRNDHRRPHGGMDAPDSNYYADHHLYNNVVGLCFLDAPASSCIKANHSGGRLPFLKKNWDNGGNRKLHDAVNCGHLGNHDNVFYAHHPKRLVSVAADHKDETLFIHKSNNNNNTAIAYTATPNATAKAKKKKKTHRNHFRSSFTKGVNLNHTAAVIPHDSLQKSSPLLPSAVNSLFYKLPSLYDASTSSAPPPNNTTSSLSSFSCFQSEDNCIKNNANDLCNEDEQYKIHFLADNEDEKHILPYLNSLNNQSCNSSNQQGSICCNTSSSLYSASSSCLSSDVLFSNALFMEDCLNDCISVNNSELVEQNIKDNEVEVTTSYENMLKEMKNMNICDASNNNYLFGSKKDFVSNSSLQAKSNAILDLEKKLFKVKNISYKLLKEADRQAGRSEKDVLEKKQILADPAKQTCNSIEDRNNRNQIKIKEQIDTLIESNANYHLVNNINESHSSQEKILQDNLKKDFHSKLSDFLNSCTNDDEEYKWDLMRQVLDALSTLSSLSNENDLNKNAKFNDNNNRHMSKDNSLNYNINNTTDYHNKNEDNTAQVHNRMNDNGIIDLNNSHADRKICGQGSFPIRSTKLISLKSNELENKNNNNSNFSKNNKTVKPSQSYFSICSSNTSCSSSSVLPSRCSPSCNYVMSDQNSRTAAIEFSSYYSSDFPCDEKASNNEKEKKKAIECAHLHSVGDLNAPASPFIKTQKVECKEGTLLVKKSQSLMVQAMNNNNICDFSGERNKCLKAKKKADEDHDSTSVKAPEEKIHLTDNPNTSLPLANSNHFVPYESSLSEWINELDALKSFLNENKCLQSLSILNCLLEIVVETQNSILIEDVMKLYDKYNVEKDMHAFNILLSSYAKQNLVTHVEEILSVVCNIYNKINYENPQNATNHNTNIASSYLKIIEGFVQINHIREAVRYIHKMKSYNLDEHISSAINLLFKLSFEKHLIKDALYALYPSVSSLQNKLDLQLIHTNEVGLININSNMSNMMNDYFPLPQASLDYLLQYCVLNKDETLLILVESLASVFGVQYSVKSLDLCIKFYAELKCCRAIYLFEKLSEEDRLTGLQKNVFLLEYVNIACKNEYMELIEKILAFSKACNDDIYFTCLVSVIQMYGDDELSKDDVSGDGVRNGGKPTFICMLRDYLQKENYLKYLQVLKKMEEDGQYICLSTRNAIIEIVVNHCDIKTAHQILLDMKNKNICNVISFNHVIKGYCNLEDLNSALKLYYEMKSIKIEANYETYIHLINCAISKSQDDVIVNLINELYRKRVKVENGILNTLIKVLRFNLSRKHIEKVLDIVDEALEENDNVLENASSNNEELVFNTLLDACVKIKDTNRMLKIIKKFRNKNMQFDLQTYGILIKAFGSCGKINECKLLWIDFANQRGLEPNDVTYGCMFDALVNNNKVDEAVLLFDEMKQKRKIKPNTIMYSTIIKGFAQAKQLDSALRIYDEMKSSGTPINAVTYNSIVDACARVGSMHTAISLLEEMLSNGVEPDLITFSTIIKGYCVLGNIDKSLQLLRAMTKRGIKSDGILYNSLLDGCVKAARSELCEELWNEMRSNGIAPSNFTLTILIKMYGRTGQLDKAFNLVHELPAQYGFEINAHVYTCLMSACITNKKFEMAYDVFHCMQRDGIKPDAKTYETIIYGCTKGAQYKQAVELVEQAFGFNNNSLSTGVSVSSYIPHPNAIGYKLEHRTYRYLLQQLQNNKHELYDPLAEKLRRCKIFVNGNSKAGSYINNHEKRV